MTLDEAIKHAEEVAEENENNAQIWHKQTKNRIVDFCDKAIQAENNCIKCAEEHRQLAEWLKDYKRLLEQEPWIPVSKELPKGLMIKTLVSCENDNGLPVCTMIAVYDGFKQKWDCDYRVKAWMSLPEPYKTECEEV